MGLRMKNFNILGVHWTIWFLGGWFTKNQGGGLPKKGDWTVCRFRGCLAREEGVVFLRGAHTPMCTMELGALPQEEYFWLCLQKRRKLAHWKNEILILFRTAIATNMFTMYQIKNSSLVYVKHVLDISIKGRFESNKYLLFIKSKTPFI